MADHKICDACETIDHCRQNGCIPLVPATTFIRFTLPRRPTTGMVSGTGARQAIVSGSVDLVKAAAHDMLDVLEGIKALTDGCKPGDLLTSNDVLAIARATNRVIDLAKGIGK